MKPRGALPKRRVRLFSMSCVLPIDRALLGNARRAYRLSRRAVAPLSGKVWVRAHRLRQLDEEARAWTAELSTRELVLPDLAAILLVHVARAKSLQ